MGEWAAAVAVADGQRTRVAEMATSDRPRERLERLGATALTGAELLAILLRTGTAKEGVLQLAERLLRDLGGLRGLAAADLPTLAAAPGCGAAKGSAIAAAFELGRRLALEGEEARPRVEGPKDIARLLQAELELLPQEELRVLVLDTKHHLLAAPMLYRGSVDQAIVRVAELFREAVRRNASAVAVAHNHPVPEVQGGTGERFKIDEAVGTQQAAAGEQRQRRRQLRRGERRVQEDAVPALHSFAAHHNSLAGRLPKKGKRRLTAH